MIKKFILPVATSAIFMLFIYKRIDIPSIIIVKNRITFTPLFIGFILLIIANFIRAKRFQVVDSSKLTLQQWLVIGQVYNMLTAALPGGSGEAMTAYTLKKVALYKFVGALRILILTRLMDVISLSVVIICIVLIIGDNVLYDNFVISISLVLFFISLLLIVPSTERIVIKFAEKVFKGNGFVRKYIYNQINNIKEAALVNKKDWVVAQSSLLSIFTILGAAFSVHYVLHAYGINFTILQSLYCFGIYALFQMVPIQGIAGIGTQAAWWSVALKAAGYNGNDNLAIGLALHATFYIFIFIIGIIAILMWFKIKK